MLTLTILLFLPVLVFATNRKVNGRITVLKKDKSGNFSNVEVQYVTEKGHIRTSNITSLLNNFIGPININLGDKITYTVDDTSFDKGEKTITAVSVNDPGIWDKDADLGEESKAPSKSGYYSNLFHKYLDSNSTLKSWTNIVFNWSLGIIGTIAVVLVSIAGIMYMTSAGNPDQIAKAKKLMLQALTGVAVIVLAKFFLTLLGTPW